MKFSSYKNRRVLLYSAVFLLAAATPLILVVLLNSPASIREELASKEGEMWIETVRESHPKIQLVHNLISPEVCKHLISLAQIKGMERALITPYGGQGLIESSTRSNTMAWLEYRLDPIVRRVENRVAQITGTKPEDAEHMQVLRYEKGQQFEPHRDCNDPEEDPVDEDNRAGNRKTTVVIYLSNAEEGGETEFTELGLKLSPPAGSAIIFSNLLPDGRPDPLAWHAGRPPIKGEKWVATKWIHERRYQYDDQSYDA